MKVQNLFKKVSVTLHRPFLGAKRLYLVLTRADVSTINVVTQRSTNHNDFNWPLPTSMSVSGLNGIANFLAWKVASLDKDLKPEERYELERDVSIHIWEMDRLDRPGL